MANGFNQAIGHLCVISGDFSISVPMHYTLPILEDIVHWLMVLIRQLDICVLSVEIFQYQHQCTIPSRFWRI